MSGNSRFDIFRYKCLHLPSGRIIDRTMPAVSRRSFMDQLIEWNRQSTLTHESSGHRWIYFVDEKPEAK